MRRTWKQWTAEHFPMPRHLSPKRQRGKLLGVLPPPPRRWECPGVDGIIVAPTKSEARAIAKQILGLRRLPIGCTLEEIIEKKAA